MRKSTERQPWFFGCWGRIGHYLWSPAGELYRHQSAGLPWSDVDGVLCPGNRNRHGDVDDRDQLEGLVRLHSKDGWTCAAWWDRSVDKRSGSNAALFVPGAHDGASILDIGRREFPSVFAQYTYELRFGAK